MSTVRSALVFSFSIVALAYGYVVYALTGRTPKQAHLSFIRLFCATRGVSRDLVANVTARIRGTSKLRSDVGVLGRLDSSRRHEIRSRLTAEGYAVFPGAVSGAVCDRLLAFALRTPAIVREMDGENDTGTTNRLALFDSAKPLGVRYDYPQKDLLGNEDVQELMADDSLLTVAQNYLGCTPKLDVVSMWWHTAYKDGPDAQAAQFFHFDMDRVKWLKAFIYLTDVGESSGPHEFVAGSHKTRGIPAPLLAKGYARLPDAEVDRWFKPGSRIRFVAPRGTIILEDTAGLHKGVHVTGMPRLMLQLQFSNSLFGATYRKESIARVVSERLKSQIESNRPIYSAYL
jgi:hypothetical protein